MEFDLLILTDVPIREFIDAAGVRWRVWSTIPFAIAGVAEALRLGWLTFEATGVRRRLAPIPRDWEDAPESRLREYCSTAIAAGQTPVTGTYRIVPRDLDR